MPSYWTAHKSPWMWRRDESYVRTLFTSHITRALLHSLDHEAVSSKHGARQHREGATRAAPAAAAVEGSANTACSWARTSVAPQPPCWVAGLGTVQRGGDELNAVCLCSGRDHHINIALIQHAVCCMLITPLPPPPPPPPAGSPVLRQDRCPNVD